MRLTGACIPLAGEGSEEDLAPAVQAHLAQEEERRERRTHVLALLEGEGLSEVLYGYSFTPAIDAYIETGGSTLQCCRLAVERPGCMAGWAMIWLLPGVRDPEVQLMSSRCVAGRAAGFDE